MMENGPALHFALAPASRALIVFGIWSFPHARSTKQKRILLTTFQILYWLFSIATISIFTINSAIEIIHYVMLAGEHLPPVKGSYPIVELICDVQHWIESVRGIALCLWLKRKQNDMFDLFSRFGELVTFFRLGKTELKAVRKAAIAQIGMVTVSVLTVTAVITWSWFNLFGPEGMDLYPFKSLLIGQYAAAWMAACVLNSILSRFLVVVVGILAGMICMCSNKLLAELQSSLECGGKLPLQYLLADVRFKYLQLLAAADHLGKATGGFVLVGLVCDIVSVCGYVGRNFQDEETLYKTRVTMARSVICAFVIAVCFITVLHYPLIRVSLMGKKLLQEVYELQASPRLKFLLEAYGVVLQENDSKARAALEYLENTIRKRPLVVSALDSVEFTGRLPHMVGVILVSYPYLLYQVIKEGTEQGAAEPHCSKEASESGRLTAKSNFTILPDFFNGTNSIPTVS